MKAVYVPWLHFHQPLVWQNNKLVSNLQKMLLSKDSRESWDGKLIARAYKNPAKYIGQLRKEGYKPRIMLDFSGILLESLKNIGKKLNKIKIEGEKIGDIIKFYKKVFKKYPGSIEIAGTAYSHCYFPAIPEKDWVYQVEEWRSIFKKIFGSKQLEKVKGFWFPEMGIPGFEDKLAELIKTIKEVGYEWCILPLQAAEGYDALTLKERIRMTCQPHLIKVKDQSIPTIFRIPTYFIDQQSGFKAEELYKKILQATSFFGESKPAMIVPAGDGENGNFMMNEFFPKVFVPFFKSRINKNISSLTVSDFLFRYYSRNGEMVPKSEIKIKTIGASWVGTHRFWLEGARRLEMVNRINKLSDEFSAVVKHLKGKKLTQTMKKSFDEAKRAFLISETSCYVYWGTDFWFDQGERMIEFARKKIRNIYAHA